MKHLFKSSQKSRIFWCLLLCTLSVLALDGCTKEYVEPQKTEAMQKENINISDYSFNQFEQLAKDYFETERVNISPFYQKREGQGIDGAKFHIDGGNHFRIKSDRTIYYIKKIVAVGDQWMDMEGDDVMILPLMDLSFDGVQQCKVEAQNGVYVISAENVLADDIFINGSYENNPVGGLNYVQLHWKVQIIGWKAQII